MSAITVLGLSRRDGGGAGRLAMHDGGPPLPLARTNGASRGACPACGSILDAPRLNRVRGEIARKCTDCGRWQPLVPFADY